ncbi:hypothetical protein DFH09DRAFT_1165623 [Mycena vulgaris]|nr:hypothetical protein DFH09DRAFT_1165623 [Mycena vulgaris]
MAIIALNLSVMARTFLGTIRAFCVGFSPNVRGPSPRMEGFLSLRECGCGFAASSVATQYAGFADTIDTHVSVPVWGYWNGIWPRTRHKAWNPGRHALELSLHMPHSEFRTSQLIVPPGNAGPQEFW